MAIAKKSNVNVIDISQLTANDIQTTMLFNVEGAIGNLQIKNIQTAHPHMAKRGADRPGAPSGMPECHCFDEESTFVRS